jgi:hypothetical protein
VAAAAVLVAAFALAGLLLVRHAARAVEVLVVVRPVPAEQRLVAADLGTVRVRGEGFKAVPAAGLGSVVGKAATGRLVAGQLLLREMLSDQPVPAPGAAAVGLSLRPGQLPGDGLEPGDRVRVLAVPARQDAAAGGVSLVRPDVLAEAAAVFAVRADPVAAGNTVVTVLVPAGQADVLSAFGSAGQVSLVEVSGR